MVVIYSGLLFLNLKIIDNIHHKYLWQILVSKFAQLTVVVIHRKDHGVEKIFLHLGNDCVVKYHGSREHFENQWPGSPHTLRWQHWSVCSRQISWQMATTVYGSTVLRSTTFFFITIIIIILYYFVVFERRTETNSRLTRSELGPTDFVYSLTVRAIIGESNPGTVHSASSHFRSYIEK